MVTDGLGIARHHEFCQLEGVAPLRLKLCQLFAADLDLIADGDLALHFLLAFIHNSLPLYSLFLDCQNLVFHHAHRRFDLHNVAGLMSEHRATER